MSSEDNGDIRAQLAALAERVAALERQLGQPATTSSEPARRLSFADQLQQRLPPNPVPNGIEGLVAYAGAARSQLGEVVWDFERNVTDLLAAEVEPLAQVLAALGSSVRLEIVRLLIQRPHTSQELQEALGLATSGPLYYHLKELLAIGLVTQPSRNQYAISPQRVIPFLAVLVAALDIKQ